MSQSTESLVFKILVWISKGLSVLLVAFFLFFLVSYIISDGIGSFSNLTAKEILMFIVFFVMVVGLSISLKWQGTGGLLTIAGYLLFALLDKNFWPGSVIPVFLLTGLLHVYLWIRQRPFISKVQSGKDE